jgi:hypothetical protein
VSAGASAVINTYAQNKNDISKVICVCGKINKPESVDSETFKKNPDFKESVFKVKESIDTLSTKELNNIMSIHPWRDQVVPINETLIKNAHEKLIPGWGHVSVYFLQLLMVFQ